MIGPSVAFWLWTAAQSPAQPPPAPLVFPSNVEMVAVDVTVVDGRGRPVTDLGPEDFTLTVAGKPRPVVSAEYISLAGPSLSSDAPAAPPPAHYSTNEGVVAGRLILIAIDQGSLPSGGIRSATAAVDRFLDRLTPVDRVALAAFPSPGPSVDFTTDHDKVRAALRSVMGRARHDSTRMSIQEALAYDDNDRSIWEPVLDRECPRSLPDNARRLCIGVLEQEAGSIAVEFRHQARASLKTMNALMDAVAGIEAPKTMVLISGGLVSDVAGEIRALANTAAQARVTLFVFQVDSPTDASFAGRINNQPDTNPTFMQTGLDALATFSRGAVFRAAGTEDAAFDRMAREMSGYYLLGFEPTSDERDGKRHDINVTVARKGLTVRAWRTVAIPSPGARRADEEVLGATLRAPFPATDVPIRVTTYSVPERKSAQVKIIVQAEIGRPDVAPGELAVAFLLLDEKGRVATSGFRRLPAEPAGPARYLGAAALDPGRYTLKLAVIDRRGRRGSVDRPVNAARHSAAGLEIADLMLADSATLESGSFHPGVDVVVAGNALAAYLELHAADPRRLQATTVTLEVAEDETEPAVVSLPAHLTDVDDGTARVAQVSVPARILPRGDYMARAVVMVEGKPVARVSRPFRVESPASSGSGRGLAPTHGIPLAELAPALGRFAREEVLRPEVVSPFLDRLEAAAKGPRSHLVEAALEKARAGRLDAALAEVKDSRDGSLAATFLRGLGLLAAGDLEPAAREFRESLRVASDFFPAAFYLGACYAAGGRDREAVGAWQTSLVGQPASAAVYAVLGDALVRLNDPEDAVSVLKEGAAAWPDDPGIRRRLGLAYAATGQADAALGLLATHLDQHPEDQGALFVVLRLMFESYASSRTASPLAGDRERMTRYARSYIAAKGPQHELVALWLKRFEH